MKKLIYLALLISLVFTIGACSSNKQKAVSADGVAVYRPAWWNEQKDKDYVYSYGQDTSLSENSSMNAAKTNAFHEAAQYVGVEVRGMLEGYESEAGVYDPQILKTITSVAEVISKVSFKGAVVGKTETRKVKEAGGTRYKTWVQLKIPKSEIEQSLVNHIHNEEALYNEFKAHEAFKRLERKVKGY